MNRREAEEKMVCPNLSEKLALVPTDPGISSIDFPPTQTTISSVDLHLFSFYHYSCNTILFSYEIPPSPFFFPKQLPANSKACLQSHKVFPSNPEAELPFFGQL